MDTSIKYPIIPFQSSYKIQIDLSAGWFNNDYKWTNYKFTVYFF